MQPRAVDGCAVGAEDSRVTVHEISSARGFLDWTDATQIPTSSGIWAVRFGELVRAQREGDAWKWVGVAPFPRVLTRVVAKDGAHAVQGVAYVLQFEGGPEVLTTDRELRDGDTWERMLSATPPDQKTAQVLATAVRLFALEAEQVTSTPAWIDGALYLPPPPYGPAGYGESACDEERARELWDAIFTSAQLSPNLALILGAAASGVYVSELGITEAPWLHLVGDSSKGKTTALFVAAALLGDPTLTFATMNTTSIGLSTYLGHLAVLPAVIDELGAAALSSASLEALGYRVAGGASRMVGTRDGGFRRGRSFRSVLLSSGNRSLASVTASPGLPARIVEIAGEITQSADHAVTLREIAAEGYGWPLKWICEAPDVAGVRGARAAAKLALAQSAGVLGRVADHLALFVAGAWRLGASFGCSAELAEAALEGAREVLATASSDLQERGRTMGDRLLEAVFEAIAARRFAFPYVTDSIGTRDAEGFSFHEGRFGVFPNALSKIAKASEIDDTLPGLRELAERGILERGDGRNLSQRHRIGPTTPRLYVFQIDYEMFRHVPTSVPTQKGPLSWNVPTVPTVPTSSRVRAYARAREDSLENASAAQLEHLLAIAREREAREGTAQEARAEYVKTMSRPTIGAYRQRGGGLEVREDGGELAEILEDARARGLALVYVEPGASITTGPVAGWDLNEAPDGRGWFGWPSDDKAAQVRVVIGEADQSPFGALEGANERTEALGAFSEALGVNWAGSGGGTFQALMRGSHRGKRRLSEMGPGVEPAFVLKGIVGEGHALAWDRDVAELVSQRNEPLFAHSFDRNGTYLAALGEVRWGLGEPIWDGSERMFDPGEKRPGWWFVRLAEGAQWPQELPNLLTPSGMAPDPKHGLWVTTPTAVFASKDLALPLCVLQSWVWDDSVAYCRAVREKLSDARAKLVENHTKSARAAYDAFKTVYSEGVNWWRANFHKDKIERRGELAFGPEGWRPNAQAQVAALARANLSRALLAAGRKSGQWPAAALRVDEIVFLSHDADALATANAIGLKMGSELGQWKAARSADVSRCGFDNYEPGRVRTTLRTQLGKA